MALSAKLIVTIVLSVVIIIVSAVNINAIGLTDIDKSSSYAVPSIEALLNKNIISGDNNEYFHPHQTVTRAEMVKMVVTALGIGNENAPHTPTFKDVPKSNWSYKYIEAAYNEGIVNGTAEDRFEPDSPCSREQMAVIMIRALGLIFDNPSEGMPLDKIGKMTDKRSISNYSRDYIEFALLSGLMKGTGSDIFDPQGNAQKEQAAVVIERLLENKQNILATAEDYKNRFGRKPKVEVNGDVLNVQASPVIQNGKVLIPYDTLNGIGNVDISYNRENGNILAESFSTESGHSEYSNLFMKLGNSEAYKNVAGNIMDPYKDASQKDKLVSISAAPVMINGRVFVPVEDIASALGFGAEWNSHEYTLHITGKYFRIYENLFEAAREHYGNNPYNGKFNVDTVIDLKDEETSDTLSITHSMHGKLNNPLSADAVPVDSRLQYAQNIEGEISTRMVTAKYPLDSYKMDYRYDLSTPEFINYKDTGNWNQIGIGPGNFSETKFIETSVYDILFPKINIPDIDFRAGSTLIRKAGDVSLNGAKLTKYTITLDNSSIDKYYIYDNNYYKQNYLSEAPFPKLERTTNFYISGFGLEPRRSYKVDNYEMTVYLNTNGKLAREEIKYSGKKFKTYKLEVPLNEVLEYVDFNVTSNIDFN